MDIECNEDNMEVRIIRNDDIEMEVDIIGIDASFANALRRIIISEVPTMAAETVFIKKNNGSIPDEMLAHRIGLVPLSINPNEYVFRSKKDELKNDNTFICNLSKKCTTSEPITVYSGDISVSSVKERRGSKVNDFIKYKDIPIAKLAKNQEISAEIHCVKGIGKEHTKWSPVGTAFYRLHPKIEILNPIENDDAYTLQKCFSKGVIHIERINDIPTAVINNQRLDTGSKNYLRYKEIASKIKYGKFQNHYIFTIESSSYYKPKEILRASLNILSARANSLLSIVSPSTE
eukprot:GHVP01005021.1.p1 GENE.GHVP01005021.1~~GHVP01005021.1.p1  ORF type:complete len:290 (+),score=54.32 GHVP01005021.1:1072-1941(+)